MKHHIFFRRRCSSPNGLYNYIWMELLSSFKPSCIDWAHYLFHEAQQQTKLCMHGSSFFRDETMKCQWILLPLLLIVTHYTWAEKIYSYHIEKKIGDDYWPYWPLSGFGHYLTDRQVCLHKLDELRREEKRDRFRLVQYEAVVIDGKIRGVVSETMQVYSSDG